MEKLMIEQEAKEKTTIELIHCRCGGQTKVDTKLVSCAPVERKRVYCSKCYISTEWMKSEAEAVEVWNKAMGERTAKVSNQIFNNSNPYTVGAWIGTCECGELVSYSSKYCHMCGAKLDWSGNE